MPFLVFFARRATGPVQHSLRFFGVSVTMGGGNGKKTWRSRGGVGMKEDMVSNLSQGHMGQSDLACPPPEPWNSTGGSFFHMMAADDPNSHNATFIEPSNVLSGKDVVGQVCKAWGD